ncbi:hypothetical protein [Streptomyces sp. NPDC005283]|uniref:hypothetical protein n=1 Tax=Streptomyces sp. NPDC005283 TaxID=3156871 RepID=UPI003451EE94
MRTRISMIAASAASLVMLTATGAQAVTDEHDHATATSGPNSNACVEDPYGHSRACFAADGDWFALYDKKADGYSAVVEWVMVKPSNNEIIRRGEIWNASGAGTWRWKNKNLTENYTLAMRSCPGNHTSGGHDVKYNLCSDYAKYKI